MSQNKIDVEEIRQFMATQPDTTKVYLGCDSERFKSKGKWFADYILAVVIHINGSKGCKIFGEIQREADHDQRVDRPFTRMMMEAQKVAELYLLLQEVFYDFEVEVHLDINPNQNHGSNCAFQAAVGYIKGICNVTPIAKPHAFAASYAADRLRELGHVQYIDQVKVA
jgi:predicted RNase H-related nuclease YkuK (DUF458 family)